MNSNEHEDGATQEQRDQAFRDLLTPYIDKSSGDEDGPRPPRPALVTFAEEMERKMALNDDKPSFRLESTNALLQKLRMEVRELEDAIKMVETPARVLEEAADVANFAYMIAELYAQVYDMVKPRT